MIASLLKLDEQLLLFINGLNSTFLDSFMWMMSSKTVWIPLYIFLAAVIVVKFRIKAIWIILILAIAIGLSDVTGSKVFKPNVKRLRPSHEIHLENKLHYVNGEDGKPYTGGTYGYFSSHASTTFCLATFVFLLFRKKNRAYSALFLWSFIIGLSRIYLGVHYPSDVITGFLFGAGYALLAFQIPFLKHLKES